MKYFLDCEFIDDGITIDLISIGIVCEDGRELYLQSLDIMVASIPIWVWSNVIPHLQQCPSMQISLHLQNNLNRTIRAHRERLERHTEYLCGNGCPWRTREQIKQEILSFLDPAQYGNLELYGWCAGYDFVTFCQLFGTMMDLPQGYPHYMKDLQQILDDRGISDNDLPQQELGLHNALADARWNRYLWTYLHKDAVS